MAESEKMALIQHFGMSQSPTNLGRNFSVPLRSGNMRSWCHVNEYDNGLFNVCNDENSFKVNLPVQQFRPDELDVKVVDNHLVVEGKHEERSDEQGYVSRHFKRRYRLPENIDENAIILELSSGGILQFYAPKKTALNPFLLDQVTDDTCRLTMNDQHFGMSQSPTNLARNFGLRLRSGHMRSCCNCNGHQIVFNENSFKTVLNPFLLDQVTDDTFRLTMNDQHFGMSQSPTNLARNFSLPLRSGYMRSCNCNGHQSVFNEKNSFKVNLCIKLFRPNELDVKVVDNHLVVEGKHEERRDFLGYISRHYKRRYCLPENVDENAITSHLFSDSVLQLCAPKQMLSSTVANVLVLPQAGGRTIPIQHTNQPALKSEHAEKSSW